MRRDEERRMRAASETGRGVPLVGSKHVVADPWGKRQSQRESTECLLFLTRDVSSLRKELRCGCERYLVTTTRIGSLHCGKLDVTTASDLAGGMQQISAPHSQLPLRR